MKNIAAERLPLPSTPAVAAYYTSTKTAWQAIYDACRQAEQTILFEEYIFNPDTVGLQFIDMLIERAREGVSVRLLLDWWGCRWLSHSRHLRRMRESGIEVAFFRPPSQWPGCRGIEIFPRDHRKLFFVDDKKAFIGGVCLFDRVSQWRDTLVEIVDSGLITQLRHVTEATWQAATQTAEPPTSPRFETHPHFTVYANAPHSRESHFSQALLDKIRGAKAHIRMTTPYFTPSPDLERALLEAVQRGVTTEMLLSDYSKLLPYAVGKLQLGRLIRAGLKAYYYQPVMLHSKIMIIDREWAAIGSCNLDGLSFYRNEEVMLVGTDDAFIKRFDQQFDADLHLSEQMDYQQWQRRKYWQKLVGYAFYPIKRWL